MAGCWTDAAVGVAAEETMRDGIKKPPAVGTLVCLPTAAGFFVEGLIFSFESDDLEFC